MIELVAEQTHTLGDLMKSPAILRSGVPGELHQLLVVGISQMSNDRFQGASRGFEVLPTSDHAHKIPPDDSSESDLVPHEPAKTHNDQDTDGDNDPKP
jgi:hypothetical protein